MIIAQRRPIRSPAQPQNMLARNTTRLANTIGIAIIAGLRPMCYLIPALHDLGEMLKGRRLAPIEFYEAARKSLHFVGYEGMAMIALAGLDMAAWGALARAAGVPLCVLLGG